MRRTVLSLLAATLLAGCSGGSGGGVAGNWKTANGRVLVISGDHTWNLVDVEENTGTWSQSGSKLVLNRKKVNGVTRTQFLDRIKKQKGDLAEGMAEADKTYATITLTVGTDEKTLTDSSGIVGKCTKQDS